MHEIQKRLTHEGVAAIRLAERTTAKDREAGQRVEIFHRLVVERERWRRERKHAPGIARLENLSDRFGCREMRIANEITLGQYLVPNRDGVPGKKSVAPIIAREPELAAAGDGLEFACVGPETK